MYGKKLGKPGKVILRDKGVIYRRLKLQILYSSVESFIDIYFVQLNPWRLEAVYDFLRLNDSLSRKIGTLYTEIGKIQL